MTTPSWLSVSWRSFLYSFPPTNQPIFMNKILRHLGIEYNLPSLMNGFKKSNGEGNGTLLQYSYLENPMDGWAWKAAVHGVTEGRTWLSDFTFTFYFHALEKEMATHSSVLAWRITGMGGLPSLGSNRVGHDWSDLAAAAAYWDYCYSKCIPAVLFIKFC